LRLGLKTLAWVAIKLYQQPGNYVPDTEALRVMWYYNLAATLSFAGREFMQY
jgi:hypothetical protein